MKKIILYGSIFIITTILLSPEDFTDFFSYSKLSWLNFSVKLLAFIIIISIFESLKKLFKKKNN